MYLITGTAGFIGFHLALSLLKKGNVVIGLDNINNYYDKKIKLDRLNLLKKYPKLKEINSISWNIEWCLNDSSSLTLVKPNFSINFFNQISDIDGIVARYDAVSIISLGIGISWVLVIGILAVIILSLSRLFGLVDDNESRIRVRIILIGFSMIFLTLPKTYEGLRIVIAFFTIYFSDKISRLMPIRE